MSQNKRKFFNIGTMTLAKKKDPNDQDEPKRFYIKLEQQKSKDGKPYGDQVFPIKLANGVVLNDGDMLAMFSKKEKFKKMVEDGKLEQDKADFLSGFLLFDICASADSESKSDDDEIPF